MKVIMLGHTSEIGSFLFFFFILKADHAWHCTQVIYPHMQFTVENVIIFRLDICSISRHRCVQVKAALLQHVCVSHA